jgi:acyl-CoA thioesterase I
MRKSHIIAIAIAAFCALALYLGAISAKVTNFPSPNRGVVAFGDSLVEGIGSERGGGFVTFLTDELKVPIANFGKSGDTTSLAIERVSKAAEMKPAVTILLLGANDFLTGVREQDIIFNLGRIIESIHASGSSVILVGVEAHVPGAHHREMFELLRDRYHVAYVPDVLEGIYGNRKLMSDGFHPNDEGYRLMAQRIAPTLKSLLR